jgi:hypothetical protein
MGPGGSAQGDGRDTRDTIFRNSLMKKNLQKVTENTVTTCHLSHGRSPTHNETDHKKNQKDNEQNPCNVGRGTGDTAESQNPGNQSDDKKSNAPT